MRKEFANFIEKIAIENPKVVFLTGDLGFMALENIKLAIGDRFINVGVSEQNMISMAASLAYEGLIPICYSIAPFIVFRPAEQIRLDVCLHNLNVKIIGNGGGYGYGIMGATHHAIEDIAILSSFQNMKCYIPLSNEDVEHALSSLFENNGPSYLRLGFGLWPNETKLINFSQFRQLQQGNKVTIIGMGSIMVNALQALSSFSNNIADVFAVSIMPLSYLSETIIESINKTKTLLIIEEHVKRGGLGENIALLLLELGITCKFIHLNAKGYENGLYGNQLYHLEQSGLDTNSLINTLKLIVNG